MDSLAKSNDLELVSGLEIHVQLNTDTKVFCPDSAAFEGDPNTHISPVSMALPGALPMLNMAVIEKAVRLGLALNCTINQYNTFDRKNYFYADLPKGYQITQDRLPVCVNGQITLQLANNVEKTIRINRIHIEEDAGKSLHDQDELYTFVNLNRAGVPLLEIVTEPDIRSAEEASALLTEIRKLVRHLDVSDGNMEEGSLRCDANISVRPVGSDVLGTRCEVKNLNSIRNLRRAIDFEYNRQSELVRNGDKIIQSTLNFNADTGVTSPMRSKEEANDYRYFPDPDLYPVFISDDWLDRIKEDMPELPAELVRTLVAETGITRLEALQLTSEPEVLNFFNAARILTSNVKSLVNWLIGPVRSMMNESETSITDLGISAEQLAGIINLVDDKKITQQNALQQLIPAVKGTDEIPSALAKRLNLLIEEDMDGLIEAINETLKRYPAQVEAYKKGKKGVLGLFVGEVMKMMRGKADPQKINEIILAQLK